MTQAKTNMTQHTSQRCIQKSKRTSLAFCSMNFSIRPSLHFRRFDSEAWSTIVTNSDRAWLPFCNSRKSRHGQWVTAPAGSDSSGRAGLKNRTIHRSTKKIKTICETQIILRLICETQIILKYLLSMNGCAIRRSRANAVQECRIRSPKRVSDIGRSMAREARRMPAKRLEQLRRRRNSPKVWENSGKFWENLPKMVLLSPCPARF